MLAIVGYTSVKGLMYLPIINYFRFYKSAAKIRIFIETAKKL